MPTHKFKSAAVIRQSWEDFKPHAVILITAVVIQMALSILVSGTAELATRAILSSTGRPPELDTTSAITIGVVRGVSQTLVHVFFQLGFITLSLKIVRGQTPQIGDLFSNFPRLGTGFLAVLILIVPFIIGFALLIVPGVILGLACFLVNWFIVDRNLSAIEAIKASFVATRGARWDIFIFGLLAILLVIIALIPCGLGLLILIPTLSIAAAHIYLALTADNLTTS
ncbi:MAG: hypothetical protein GY768_03700 [Planctomycetaceae bacterium]|nr:hypothetical protein [Planctomycetaceae bacterium]